MKIILRRLVLCLTIGSIVISVTLAQSDGLGQNSATQGAWLTPPGHPCTEQYRMLDEPRGDQCLIVPDDNETDTSPDVRTGTIMTPSGPQEVTYIVIDGLAITEGDIILGEAETFAAQGLSGAGRYDEGIGLASGWSNCIIPYTIDPSLPNPQRVYDAMAHWQSLTCMQFVERTTERDYVTFRSGSGCSSSVGRRGGRQYVNLARGCSTGATIHEIGHVVGLWHEQGRADRDSYIIILYENIRTGYASQFAQYRVGVDYGDYDFGSIMHYGSYAFSGTGGPTITKIDGSTFTVQRRSLSDTDLLAVATMYGAP